VIIQELGLPTIRLEGFCGIQEPDREGEESKETTYEHSKTTIYSESEPELSSSQVVALRAGAEVLTLGATRVRVLLTMS
jgi:hypothetical protein